MIRSQVAGRNAAAKCTPISSDILGFIFCGIFSNLGATGCRRGRTPERPLRQPSKGLADQARPFLVLRARLRTFTRGPMSESGLTQVSVAVHTLQRVQSVGNLGLPRFQTAAQSASSAQRSQIGIAKCCVPRRITSTVESGSFPFRYQTRGSGTPGGRTQEASDVPAEIARSFAELRWTAPCRECPGRSGGGGTSGSLSRQERESVPGVKRSQRCISRTA